MIESLLDRATRAIDSAVLWKLGSMPVSVPTIRDYAPIDVGDFWRESHVAQPSRVHVVRRLGEHSNGRIEVVDLEGPSQGPGIHPGSRKLLARAHLRKNASRDAPLVLLLHGFAVPVAWYEEGTSRALTKRGAHAVRMDHPFHLRRRARGARSGEGYLSADPERIRASVRQSVEDAAALVAWAREELTDHVAVLGVSLGGLAACLLAAQVELDAMVAVAPFCDPSATLLQRLPLRARHRMGMVGSSYGPWGESEARATEALQGALAPIIARNHVSPVTPAERITLIRPEHDLIVGAEPIAELARIWGCELLDLRHGHISVMRAKGLTRLMHDRLLTTPQQRSQVPLAG